MTDWRLTHVWLRGYSDALCGVDRRACYTEEARSFYLRGRARAVPLELAA